MEETIEQMIMFMVYGIIGMCMISIGYMCMDRLNLNDLFIFAYSDAGNHFSLKEQDFVDIQVYNTMLKRNEEFNALEHIDLYYENTVKNDLKDKIEVYGYVNTSICGEYPITYVIRYKDIVSRQTVCFKVKDESHF